MIAVGGAGGGGHGKDVSKNLTQAQKTTNLILAIIMAVVTGLVFALNSLSLKYCSDIGCGESQANLDAMFWMFVILLPGFLVFANQPKPKGKESNLAGPYGIFELGVATAILLTQVFGIISLAVGLNNGSAGPVQAIEN